MNSKERETRMFAMRRLQNRNIRKKNEGSKDRKIEMQITSSQKVPTSPK